MFQQSTPSFAVFATKELVKKRKTSEFGSTVNEKKEEAASGNIVKITTNLGH